MRIAEANLENFSCFQGTTTLALEAKAYAVVAEKEKDPDQSNWSGKSTLLEIVLFALTGYLPRRRYRLEDDWISRGMNAGAVELKFDDGFRIRRSRKRGKRTELVAGLPIDGDNKQDQAQSLIDTWLGLSEEDLRATCVFEQRQIAKLVLDDPSERMAVVSRWFGLAKLVRGEEIACAETTLLTDQVGKLEQEIEIADRELVVVEATYADPPDVEMLRKNHSDAQAEQAAAAQAMLGVRQLGEAAERKRRFDQLVQEGNALRDRVKTMETEVGNAEPPSDAGLESIAEELGNLNRKIAELNNVVTGTFDGKCPVLQGFACPAKDTINGSRDEARASRKVLDANVQALLPRRNDIVGRRLKHQESVSLLTRSQGQLETMKKDALSLYEKVKADAALQSLDVDALSRNLSEANGRLDLASEAKRRAENYVSGLEYQRQKVTILKSKLGALRPRQAVANAGVQIFGKNGIQRRVAERSLHRIERDANTLLSTSGIPLSVLVQWSKDGQGLAKTCDACGFPFPSSARVKTCSKCGAERGQNIINKLEFELSDRSGAAEDLAGIALQLAAARWLRAERSSNWGVALLDEPFGQLDTYNRRALGTQIGSMLSGEYGFEQAFLIAHNSSALDALPGRILITRDGNVSRVKVAA